MNLTNGVFPYRDQDSVSTILTLHLIMQVKTMEIILITTLYCHLPYYLGTLMGITNMAANFTGIIAPFVAGKLVNDHARFSGLHFN